MNNQKIQKYRYKLSKANTYEKAKIYRQKLHYYSGIQSGGKTKKDVMEAIESVKEKMKAMDEDIKKCRETANVSEQVMEDLNKKGVEVDALNTKITELEKKLEAAGESTQALEEAKKKAAELEKNANEMKGEMENLKRQVAEKESAFKDLQQEHDEFKTQSEDGLTEILSALNELIDKPGDKPEEEEKKEEEKPERQTVPVLESTPGTLESISRPAPVKKEGFFGLWGGNGCGSCGLPPLPLKK